MEEHSTANWKVEKESGNTSYLLRILAAFAHKKRMEIKSSRTFDTKDTRAYPATSKITQEAIAPRSIPNVTFFLLHRITSATVRHNYIKSINCKCTYIIMFNNIRKLSIQVNCSKLQKSSTFRKEKQFCLSTPVIK